MSTPRFNIQKFKDFFEDEPNPEDRAVQIQEMAKVAESAERYEDMCKFMKELVTLKSTEKLSLDVEERNLLSVAYKNVIGTRRAAWRTLKAEVDQQGGPLVERYLDQVEKELSTTCKEVANLLDLLIPLAESRKENGSDPNLSEPVVFYLKMAGDYYRYLAESDNKDSSKQKAKDYYLRAYDIAEDKLNSTHPIRLGLALNFSVCYYEILKDPKEACKLAKKAFDDAISKLDSLDEHDYKDSTLIMQLLRDNLTLWTTADDGGEVEVQDFSDDEN